MPRAPTLVTVRFRVWVASSSATAMDGALKLLGSSTGIPLVVQKEAGSWVPQRKPSQSPHVESKTRPGSAAAVGLTWPAPCRKMTSGLVFGPSSTSWRSS